MRTTLHQSPCLRVPPLSPCCRRQTPTTNYHECQPITCDFLALGVWGNAPQKLCFGGKMRKHPRAPAPNPLRALCLSAPLREIFPLSNYHLPTTVKPVHYSLLPIRCASRLRRWHGEGEMARRHGGCFGGALVHNSPSISLSPCTSVISVLPSADTNHQLPTTVKPVHYSLSPIRCASRARDPIGGMGVVEQRNIW